jgi:hypothetical protein
MLVPSQYQISRTLHSADWHHSIQSCHENISMRRSNPWYVHDQSTQFFFARKIARKIVHLIIDSSLVSNVRTTSIQRKKEKKKGRHQKTLKCLGPVLINNRERCYPVLWVSITQSHGRLGASGMANRASPWYRMTAFLAPASGRCFSFLSLGGV